MQGHFRLWIELGNDAMNRRCDIVAALKAAAIRVSGGMNEGKIRDDNGNAVGQFEIEEDDK